jgi:hypothetical protein
MAQVERADAKSGVSSAPRPAASSAPRREGDVEHSATPPPRTGRERDVPPPPADGEVLDVPEFIPPR